MLTLAEKVDPKKCLLLVVDVQNDFCHPDGSMGRAGQDLSMVDEMMPPLLNLLEEARRVGTPVIFTAAVHVPWTDSQAWATRLHGANVDMPHHCREGSWGAELYEVSAREDERVLVKRRFSAFYATDLDVMLRALGTRALIMSGVATNVCVETTARDGFMRDYHIVYASDCCASYDRGEHEGTLRNISKYFGQVSTSSEIIGIWKGLPSAEKK